MKTVLRAMLLGVVLLGGAAHAQAACTPAEVDPGQNTPAGVPPSVTVPAGFTSLDKAQVRKADGSFTDANLGGQAANLAPGKIWGATVIAALRAEATRLNGTPVLLFSGAAGAKCFQTVKLEGAAANPPVGASAATEAKAPPPPGTGSLEECREAASQWQTEIVKQTKGGRSSGYTLIVFMESGEICHANRDYGVEGDPIYVGVYTALTNWAPTRFEPCAIEPAAPAVYVSVDKVALTKEESARQAGGFTLRKNTPRRCFNANVDISFRQTGTTGETGAIRYNLSQHRRYRATLQLGAIFTPQHVREFDVRPEGEENILYSKGPNGRGVEYTASLVLYGAPRYVLSLFGGPSYPGRDLVHDQGVLDRLGAVLGIGLTQPGRRFVAGLSFEVLYGVNVLYVADVLRAPQPVGAELNEPFAGTRDDIRTEDRWNTRGVFGLSVDLLYVKELFSGRITP
ncbi:hypothetical protein ACLESD_31410 [Pyxidicoccus sp. 3LFB2]